MARSPFVTTSSKRLDLTGVWEGEWVEVKEHLGVADQQRINGSVFTSMKQADPDLSTAAQAEASVDLGRLYMTELKVYLLAWSFRDGNGQPVEVTPTAINMLDPECAEEIMDRLHAWQKEVAAARAENPPTKTSSAQRSA